MTKVKDGYSQTSEFLDDSASSDSSSKEDELEEEFVKATSAPSKKTSSRSILGRLTSAHIRQFVSPDFKEEFFQFHVPSLASSTKSKANEVNSRKFAEKLRNKLQTEVAKSKKKSTKETKKVKKTILERLCSPTLSFILKTRKESKENTEEPNKNSSDILRPPPSPCERFNRRNPPN